MRGRIASRVGSGSAIAHLVVHTTGVRLDMIVLGALSLDVYVASSRFILTGRAATGEVESGLGCSAGRRGVHVRIVWRLGEHLPRADDLVVGRPDFVSSERPEGHPSRLSQVVSVRRRTGTCLVNSQSSTGHSPLARRKRSAGPLLAHWLAGLGFVALEAIPPQIFICTPRSSSSWTTMRFCFSFWFCSASPSELAPGLLALCYLGPQNAGS